MQRKRPSRRNTFAGLAMLLALGLTMPAWAQMQQPHAHPASPVAHVGPAPNRPGPHQEHLAQWMSRHQSLPLPQQQRALESEPGFRDLAPPVQQRMRDRLTQLNNMPPAQRQHVLDRAEAIEHLSPDQRQQVRGAMLQLGGLPEDRRRVVARAFRDLRQLPPAQREGYLSSDQFRTQFSDQERSTLSGLIAVEPYLPAQRQRSQPGPPPGMPPGPPE